jgi:hypothetical protein
MYSRMINEKGLKTNYSACVHIKKTGRIVQGVDEKEIKLSDTKAQPVRLLKR